ncbi:unnamed protein product, partial [marine sediment metagenome]
MMQHCKNIDTLDTIKNDINNTESFFKNTLSLRKNNKPLIGWFCTYTPEELIIAGSFTPKRIFGSKKIIKAESYFPINFCPYLKSSWESLLSDSDNLEAIIFTNSCDGMRRLYDTANIYLKDTPSYILDVPRLKSESSINFFKSNLDDMQRFIENLSGKKIKRKKLEETVKLANNKRRLLKKFSEIFFKMSDL